jgi:hypothetical protein
MKITIFYSWQSTTDAKYNKNFISDCIEDAVKKIKQIPDFRTIDFEVLDGVKGTSGSQPVSKIITDDRIPNCDIFIADLSVVNSINRVQKFVRKITKDKYKPVQNNNVILEYGVAMNAISVDRIIGVLNSKYGSPNENVENIPFDIRHLRYPIEYNYYKKNKSEKSKIKKQLIYSFKKALVPTVQFAIQNQKNRFKPFMIWQEWDEQLHISQEFISNNKIEEIKKTIIDNLSKNNPIRILGLSGLGKTRILLEIFRPIDSDNDSLLLSNRVLYLNCNDYPPINFPEIISAIVSNKNDVILIVDNCNLETHRQLVRIVNTSAISLITIYYNPEENKYDKVNGTDYIEINKKDLVDIIASLLERDFGDLEQANKEKIKEFAQGIPQMAVLLGESVRNGEEFVGRLDDKSLLDKLLGEKGKEKECRAILKSCSLFDYFGYKDTHISQTEFIAKNKNITNLIGDDECRVTSFIEVVEHYIKRQIFEYRGRYLAMRPFPLAISLAQEWFATHTPQNFLSLIEDIAKLTEPDRTNLSNSLAEQMGYLGYDEKAVYIVDKIVGIENPFDNAEVLNTELGSRLFRSFVEVNPIAVSQNFNRQFSNKTTEELLKVEAGRRNIVWTLEKLCFYKRTFSESSKILFAFGVAENEHFSNNATGQFLHLFNIFLAGTEANLKDRWDIIEWGLNKIDAKFYQLALKAMQSGLNSHFLRFKGGEQQGTKELQDYTPTRQEIDEYWNKIFDKLTEIIGQNNQYSEFASEIVANSIRATFLYSNIILLHLEKIIVLKNNDWDKGLENLKKTLHYDKERLPKEVIESLKKMIKSLTKSDFISRFFASTHYEDDEIKWSAEKFIQKEEKRMRSLAKEFIETNMSWDDYLPVFYEKSDKFLQCKSDFGKSVYEILENNTEKQYLFVEKSLLIAESIEKENIDFTVLAGFIEKANKEIKERFYSLLYQSKKLNFSLFMFMSFDENGKNYFGMLFDLLDKKECDISNLSNFKYRIALQKLNDKDIQTLKEKLFSYGEDGYALIFTLYYSIWNEENNNQQLLKTIIKECILKLGIDYHKIKYITDYEWAKCITSILEDENENEFAQFIMNSIISSIDWKNTYHLDTYIQEICVVLIKKHFKVIWIDLSQALLSEDEKYRIFYGLKHIFGSYIGSALNREVGILFDDNIDMIFEWCKEKQPLAPCRLAELVPIFGGDNSNSPWNPITQRLIDEFGNIPEVLNNISCNMGNFSWTGSVVPLLESKKQLFESLSSHVFLEVRDWANKNLLYLDKDIETEKNRDAEMFI